MHVYHLEIYKNKVWEFGRLPAACGCVIVDIGPIGVTWLVGDCYLKRNEQEDSSDKLQ